jgi:hypothetical protein
VFKEMISNGIGGLVTGVGFVGDAFGVEIEEVVVRGTFVS